MPRGMEHPTYWLEPTPPHDVPVTALRPDFDAPFIFLSYASQNRDAAEALLTLLKDEGLPFWWDQYILGDGWRDQIAERLDGAKAVLTL